MATTGGFFSPSAKKDNRIAAKKPLAPIGSDDYNKEVEQFIKDIKDDFIYREKYDVDTGEPRDRYGNIIEGRRFGEEEMRRDYPYRRQFRYENWDGEKYTPGVPFGKADTDTEVAGLFGYSDDEIERRKVLSEIINTPGYDPKSVTEAQRQLQRLNQGLNPFDKKVEAPKENILNKVGNFLANTFTFSQPVAAGTLDANQQVSQVSERPKLNYVNPDAKTMSLSQIADAFKPKNLFGYQDKFGRYDDPGSPLDRQRQETMQRVAANFNAPIVGDARTIAQIRADQKAKMQENARLRNEAFQNRVTGPAANIQKTFGADDTYGTNVPSNPAMGFRDQMSAESRAAYDKAAREATAGAQTDPSLGNVFTQTYNRVAKRFGLPQKSLETVDQRQLRKAQEAYNRPQYQQEAYARKMLGITNDQLKARNLQQIRANAFARNQAFQSEKVQRALEKAAKRRGENIGTGRDGGFGLGTSGQGMPSNPKGFSGYSRKSSPSTRTSKSGGGISKSTSRKQGGGPSSKSKGGVSKGVSKSNTGSKKASRGTAGSSSKGGSFGGGKKSNTGSKKASRCDIRTKIDITSLTDQNLMKDDLATVAYFVQELRGH